MVGRIRILGGLLMLRNDTKITFKILILISVTINISELVYYSNLCKKFSLVFMHTTRFIMQMHELVQEKHRSKYSK